MAQVAAPDSIVVVPDSALVGVRGELQIIRAETQNWLRSIADLNSKADVTDAEARARELDTTFKESLDVAQQDIPNVRTLFSSLDQRLRRDPTLAQMVGDEVTNISNAWHRADIEFENLKGARPAGDTILPPLVAIKAHLEEVVRRCGFLTIPTRVNEHLRGLRIGQGLDFNATFQDELPAATDRQEILRFMRDHPAKVNGVIDVQKGMIFKASSSAWRRYLSLSFIAVAVGLDFLILWLVAAFTSINVPGAALDADRWPVLWHALMAALIGGVAHILVSAIKQSRDQASGEAFRAIDDLLLWAHIREVQLIASVLSFAVAMFGLILVLKLTDAKTAFFVGYSLDSFVDIFLQRFDKTASAQVASIMASAQAAA